MVNARLCILVVYTGRVARDGNPKQTGYNSKTVLDRKSSVVEPLTTLSLYLSEGLVQDYVMQTKIFP